jgi:hypothetical protein
MPKPPLLHDLGQVEQRARNARDRNAVFHGAILGMEPAGPVECDSGTVVPRSPRRDHIDC